MRNKYKQVKEFIVKCQIMNWTESCTVHDVYTSYIYTNNIGNYSYTLVYA